MGEDAHSISDSVKQYLNGRWTDQCGYFESKATKNQKSYLVTRLVTLWASWLTPIAIFFTVIVRSRASELVDLYDFVPLLLSTVAIGSYQWEELHNYGSQWAKFRLVAERLKGHRQLFQTRAGPYANIKSDDEAFRYFVEYCEGLIEGTDVNYFVLMVDPRRQERT